MKLLKIKTQSLPKWVTPDVLRNCMPLLWDGLSDMPIVNDRYICNILERLGHNSQEFEDWLCAVGFINESGSPLFFFPEIEYIEQRVAYKQGVRFMLLELLALALEDGAL